MTTIQKISKQAKKVLEENEKLEKLISLLPKSVKDELFVEENYFAIGEESYGHLEMLSKLTPLDFLK